MHTHLLLSYISKYFQREHDVDTYFPKTWLYHGDHAHATICGGAVT